VIGIHLSILRATSSTSQQKVLLERRLLFFLRRKCGGYSHTSFKVKNVSLPQLDQTESDFDSTDFENPEHSIASQLA
jgi:hypothetical protein